MTGLRQLGLAVFIFSGAAGSAQIASQAELAAISARGRMLYEYDQAAWHATDAVLATNPPRVLLGMYIAHKTDAGWEVVFGHLNEPGGGGRGAGGAAQGA